MKEKTLLKIALAGSIIGVLVLFLVSGTMEIDQEKIAHIEESHLGSTTKLTGMVSQVSHRGNLTTIELNQLETISVVVFNEHVSLFKGDYIEVTGMIDEYRGNVQVIAEAIELK